MDWQDEGMVLAARPHGEGAAIVELFTPAHGRHLGVVPGGRSRRNAPLLQPGAQVAARWRARLEDHMGQFRLEVVQGRAGRVLDDPAALAGLAGVCALLRTALPEREPHARLYAESLALLDRIGAAPDWPAAYLRWEMRLLEDLGFGLDLGTCAVTGQREDLAYVSPRSGRAVSRAGAGDWAGRLFPLPPGLLGQGPVIGAELAQGLAITGHFLALGLAPVLAERGLPAARARLVQRLTAGPAATGPAGG